MKQKMGRKTNEGGTRRRVNLMLSEDTINRLSSLGKGNLSEGARAAVMGRSKPYAAQRKPRTRPKLNKTVA